MKNIFNLLIIIVAICSLYFLRNDIGRAYTRIANFVSTNILYGPASSSDSATSNSNQNSTSTGTLIGVQKVVETPGALRVVDSVLSATIDKSNLTQAGVIAETNLNRKEAANLPPLIENAKLDLSAKEKLDDMFAKQYFEHISPSGVGVSDLATEQGYDYIIIGENLALGDFKDNASLLTAWMNSPGHRANILNVRYTNIGVAVGKGVFEGKETWLAVQHFGLPRSACPAIDSSLKNTIETTQAKITAMQAHLATLKNQIDSGGASDPNHNQEVDDYNKLVVIYNSLINETKTDINAYNNEVKAFNACVQG